MRALGRTLLLLAALAACGIGSEIVVRLLGSIDVNGQFHLHGYWVRPRRLPVRSFEQNMRAYEKSPDNALGYDAELGWSPRPGHASADGLYRYDAIGARADREYASEPDSGVVRVLLFGDSFTHGDLVALEDTFEEVAAAAVDESLQASPGGPPFTGVEIVNLGVPGYGFDQAYLRFHREAERLHPDIVVLGFQPENVKRVTNIVRLFYYPLSGLPFSKPRFVLSRGNPGDGTDRVSETFADDGDAPALSLVNQPCATPREVAAIVRDPSAWTLCRYEAYFDEADYRPAWWRASRFLSFTADVSEAHLRPEQSPFDPDAESARITLALIDRFAQESEAMSARFLVLHLPTYAYLDRWRKLGRLEYQDLWDTIGARHSVIGTESALWQVCGDEPRALFHHYHYNELGHSAVARVLADTLLVEMRRLTE
ncbi:MAG: SGNH/GDSL hydrolase family protein [Candidatus Eisenbacteria bacterium]|uniref:SGNH/GDSL hydrolase family protein n=1 Tax=Eiseniibacteriota bacterium TaxID=2212470 RepID=A0A956M172_UNCEI|nr:SGNH/GDSL hydrolase family protein [Candidatus Eisenbacteria bacterium]